MKVVIDIPEDFYKEWCDYIIPSNKVTACTHIIIQQGTVLPKGHGELIDKDIVLDMINYGILEEYITVLGGVIPADR